MFQPDWVAAKQRALDMAEALHDHVQSKPYDVLSVRFNPFVDPKELPSGPKAALDTFIKALGERRALEYNFSTRDGEFFLHRPKTVHALITGTEPSFRGDLVPAVFAIVEQPAKHFAWYVTALRIVAETCDYVLAQPDKASHWLRWSA